MIRGAQAKNELNVFAEICGFTTYLFPSRKYAALISV